MILSFETKHFDKGNKEKESTSSLLAFVPGTQAEDLLHKRDASFRHEDFPVSSDAEGLFFSDAIIDNLTAGTSLATPFATPDEPNESRVAGIINAKNSRLNSSSGAAKADRTTSIGENRSMVRTLD